MSTSFQSVQSARQSSKWLLVDAEGQTLGRLASQVASIIRGKHKPTFSPHTDCGDFVIVINASKIKLTGKKMQNKEYYWHTTFIGGLKTMTADKLLAKSPERMLTLAVKGMLPKGNLGRNLIKKLKIYDGAEHEHSAQMPQTLKLRYS